MYRECNTYNLPIVTNHGGDIRTARTTIGFISITIYLKFIVLYNPCFIEFIKGNTNVI